MNQVMSAALSVDVELYHFLLHVHADFDQTSNINSFFKKRKKKIIGWHSKHKLFCVD